MQKIKENKGFIFLSGLYLIIQALILYKKPDYFLVFSLLPIALFFLFTFIFSIEQIVWIIVFTTPLAVPLKEYVSTTNMDLSLPGEPFMAGLLLVSLFHQIQSPFLSRKFLRHPISIMIGIQLLWIFITSLNSTMPEVSFKFLAARLWFLCTAFYLMSELFKKKMNIFKFLWLFLIPLALIALYTFSKHLPLGLDEQTATWIVQPHFNDHTAYGAAIALFIPLAVAFVWLNRKDKKMFIASIALLFALLLGITFSYARAAWIGVAAAFGLSVLLYFRVKFITILSVIGLLVGLFFAFQTELLLLMAKNNTDSDGDFQANIESMTNISTDASNLERLNRWSCALRMHDQKPWMGWGPGTYMFNYASFQKKSERTIITVDDGSNGNAHSEYLGPLSEQGIPGLAIVIMLMYFIYTTGFRLAYRVKETKLRVITQALLLGLTTYFVHGFLNNFLDTDKLAIPFWGFVCALVCIDLYHQSDSIEN